MPADDEPTTQELRLEQLRREARERKQAEASIEDDEAEQHERRAQKASYLREKLEERAEAEREAEDMEHDERADELERETEQQAERSERLEREIDETRSDWEAKKSDPSAPGATEPEASGAHQLESEDPASGEAKGEERLAELEDAAQADAEREEEER